ncbi:MAG: hypothetical protein HKM89_04030, partial [Gemmatimonadales bacterium]|nr:hypothetical protein [Gemmatimonadales bacterium]
ATPGGDETDSGIEGLVTRGPIQPVCVVDIPCDEPFAALFHVTQDGREIATFRSDDEGQFAIDLLPGDYTITPDATAPIIFPTRQAKTVRVESNTVARIELDFDTGIR